MTKAELIAQIAELEKSVAKLSEPDKSLKQLELSTLKIQLEGMALADIVAKLKNMPFPDIDELKTKVAAANDAVKAHNERLELVDRAIAIVKTGLQIAL